MSDMNVKIVLSADSSFREPKTSSYLLDDTVLDELKDAIKQAKSAAAGSKAPEATEE